MRRMAWPQDLRLEFDALLTGGPRHEEQVLDEAQQSLGIGRDVAHHVGLTCRQPLDRLQQSGIAEDRRDRGSQLVRDESKELVLDGRRRMKRLLRSAAFPSRRPAR